MMATETTNLRDGLPREETPLEWVIMIAGGLLGVLFVVWRRGHFAGRHMALLCIHFFATIIIVNVFMAYNAVSTFPGLEVSSSYADSQTFDERREAQEALGWHASVSANGNVVNLTLVDEAGRPVYPAELEALLTRPTTRTDDQLLDLTRGPNGVLVAEAELAPGIWRLRMTGTARDGTEYRHNLTFRME